MPGFRRWIPIPQLYLTSEKKQVIVDSFVKWKVRDVEQYYTSTGGNPLIANQRLSVVVVKVLRDEFGKRTVHQVVSGERAEIMETMRGAASNQADELGIEIVDVRIKRVDLPEGVSQSVFNRMQAERKQVAKRFRSEGEELARKIRAQAERERTVILSEAEREGRRSAATAMRWRPRPTPAPTGRTASSTPSTAAWTPTATPSATLPTCC